jgi:NAD+ kinase
MKKRFTPPRDISIGILGNADKSATCETAYELIRILDDRNIAFVVQDDIAGQMKAKCGYDAMRAAIPRSQVPGKVDVVVSLGGDGTILQTAGTVGDLGKPILGVNLGKLGFLAELNLNELKNSIDELFRGKFNLEERTVLEATFEENGQTAKMFALNDIVVDKAGSSRMIDLETYVDSEYLITYRGDGIVISTPTGSTGYCLSTGGPIIAPESRVIAISPISPHTLSARPVIVPDTCQIRVVARSTMKNVMIIADGQASRPLPQPAEVRVSLAPRRIILLRKSKNGFFNLLRTKLMWGVDIRSEERE